MYTLEELKPKIIEWANERDLIHSENADKQRLKLIEECGELASAILKNDIELQKDSLGDVFVVLTILEAQLQNIKTCMKIDKKMILDIPKRNVLDNTFLIKRLIQTPMSLAYSLTNLSINLKHDLTECVNLAYNEIKNRRGVAKNGTFIKDSTPSDYIMD